MWEGARLVARVGLGLGLGRVGVVADGRPQINKFQRVHLWSHGYPPPCKQTHRQTDRNNWKHYLPVDYVYGL